MNRTRRTWRLGVFLTIRSITRGNIGTTTMTVVMMSLIFINLIFLTALVNGLSRTAEQQIVQTLNGHILVEPESGVTGIARPDDVRANVALVPGVTDISQRQNFSAELEFDGEQGSYRGVAIDPVDEASVTTLEEKIVAGRYFNAEDTNAVILGNQIVGGPDVELDAYSLGGVVSVGDEITVRYTNGPEKQYEVIGIVDSDFVQADNRFFVTAKEYSALFPSQSAVASEFAVHLSSDADLNAVADRIENDNDVSVRTWEETAGIVESFTSSFDVINFVASMVALIVAGITIFIVMYIDVVNRRRQIGILRAIGIAETAIAISYLLRAILYGVFGVMLGAILFKYAITPVFDARPLKLPLGYVSLIVDNTTIYIRGLALMLVSFLGAYIPIRRALKMHIIDAIWGN